MTGIEYEDFLDRSYRPDASELRCEFQVVPARDLSVESVAGRVASESSNGTWSKLTVDASITDLSATAYDIDGNTIRIAYPPTLFDPGNMAQVLSCIAGNIMGMKAVSRIRLLDVEWPKTILDAYPGPQFGTAVRGDFFDAPNRPITATVPKPKVGLDTDAHATIGYDAWTGGLDLLKDDENLTDQAFNPFQDRLTTTLSRRDEAESETGEPKSYLVNITADANTMLERVDAVANAGGEYVMVDVITCGWAAVQTVRERCAETGLAIHAHRAMHAAFDRVPDHGVSMRVLAQIGRLCGVDQIHTGTANLGKLENEDSVGINEWLLGSAGDLRPVLPTASGGLHPGLIPELVDRLGTTLCIQAGGGVHGHPDGTHAGATALRAAVDATVAGESLESRAESVPALRTALDTWGTSRPR